MNPTAIIEVVIGLILLGFGLRLYWLFVAGIGFMVGMEFAHQYFQPQPEWVILLIAVGCGLIGAILAYLFQRIAIALAGFLAGGGIALRLAALMALPAETGNPADPRWWIPFLIGGLIGAILVSVLFDWALIFLSSLVGAGMVAAALRLHSPTRFVAILALAVVGIVIQTRLRQRPAPAAASHPRQS